MARKSCFSGMTPAWHPLVMMLKWAERSAYRDADRVVSLLAGTEGYMTARGLPSGKFVWIPNGVSDGEIQSALDIGKTRHPLVDQSGK